MGENNNRTPKISCTGTQPYRVTGITHLEGPLGEALETGDTVLLCRCGHSKNMPYCDNSHVDSGFSAEKEEGRVPDREKNYYGEKIIVHDNHGVCSHDGACINELPEVFNTAKRPWINADGAPVEDIVETIHHCPSGALCYSIDGVRYVPPEREPAIRVAWRGPLEVTGSVPYEDDLGNRPHDPEHYTLCRCGHSKNKPFCDGAHMRHTFVEKRYRT